MESIKGIPEAPVSHSKSAIQMIIPTEFNLPNFTWIKNDEPKVYTSVLWTDEACHTRYGYFNTHDRHIGTKENLHAVHRLHHHQWKFSVNISAGIIDNYFVVGPYLFTAQLDGHVYTIFHWSHPLPAYLNLARPSWASWIQCASPLGRLFFSSSMYCLTFLRQGQPNSILSVWFFQLCP